MGESRRGNTANDFTENDILELMNANSEVYRAAREAAYRDYILIDEYIKKHWEKMAVHRHFKTKKAMKEAMLRHLNPWDTFSYGKKDPMKEIEANKKVK